MPAIARREIASRSRREQTLMATGIPFSRPEPGAAAFPPGALHRQIAMLGSALRRHRRRVLLHHASLGRRIRRTKCIEKNARRFPSDRRNADTNTRHTFWLAWPIGTARTHPAGWMRSRSAYRPSKPKCMARIGVRIAPIRRKSSGVLFDTFRTSNAASQARVMKQNSASMPA